MTREEFNDNIKDFSAITLASYVFDKCSDETFEKIKLLLVKEVQDLAYMLDDYENIYDKLLDIAEDPLK